ncbi:hypothetical protein PSTG_17195 [Puccinia striiformis f. sp. tritici PST-78]|uniref:Uncharacterized protein n=1 Tax=Puccinia striiformis f. sp. tritici PST-78 TaxID=1165861 RepID=A0A0L0UQU9_9BASI|nr:hypothetical protein PSTG_17195 [Puccinia striiformis f. sp. tritici PST-78]
MAASGSMSAITGLMVHMQSTNPEIIRPDFSVRVTPQRTNQPSVQSAPSTPLSSVAFISADMSHTPFGSPSVPNPSPGANICKEPEDDQQSQDAHASSLGALNDAVQEEIQQNRGLNLDSDLDLEPLLLLDGSNFPAWLAALKDAVASVTSDKAYFALDKSSSDLPTSHGVLAIIKFSVDPVLHSLLNRMTVHGAYSSLSERFANPSWSLLLSRWSAVAQAPEASDSISPGYQAIKRSLLDLEERLGGGQQLSCYPFPSTPASNDTTSHLLTQWTLELPSIRAIESSQRIF